MASQPLLFLPQGPDAHCFHCGYNLTGTIEPRCPECGRPFDNSAYRRWFDGEDPLPRGLFRTGWVLPLMLMSLCQPARLARLLSPNLSPGRLLVYCECVRLIAVAILPLVMFNAFAYDRIGVELILTISLTAWVASKACEHLVSYLLRLCVEPAGGDAVGDYAYWSVTVRCFVGHLAPTMAMLVWGAWDEGTLFGRAVWMIPGMFALPWWWWCLTRAIMRRGVPGVGMVVGIVLVPIVAIPGVAAILAGLFLFILAIPLMLSSG